jgi:SAM-dependent methyltransferase
MVTSRDEREAKEEFSLRYATERGDIMDLIEQRVIGDVWGANGFTTRAQADDLAGHLRLAPGGSLLDIGSGRGWPGLYLAHKTGCSVTLVDLPAEGLTLAIERARHEGVAARAVVGSGSRLPFRDDAFDAIVHTDVLC